MNYYIVGSKYGSQREGFDDVFPLMLKNGVVAIGFNGNEDMSDYVGESHEVIISHLKKVKASNKSYTPLKYFLNLKPGDLVAVKIHSAPSGKKARLVIGAYAIVKGEDFPVYRHCDELGHTIEVDFFETGMKYELPLGYGKTLHKITEIDRIESIFGFYSNERKESTNKDVDLLLKGAGDVVVEATAGYVSSRAHNKIQNILAIGLAKKYGVETVKIESEFIDVLVELEDKNILYEVKSSLSPDRCIREALGQILQYGHKMKLKSGKAIEYVVVGPSKVEDSDGSYYAYVKSIVGEPFEYMQIPKS